LVGTLTISKVNVASGASKAERVKFTYSSGMTGGNYYLIASVATNASTADATATSPTTIAVSARSVDLAATFAASQPIAVSPGKQRTVAVRITNRGNITAIGTLGLNLYASSGTTLDALSQLLTTIAARRISLKPGKSITIDVSFTAPDQAGGTYNLLASISPSMQLADANTANNVASIATRPVA
jgi:uncharacterized membrane protein